MKSQANWCVVPSLAPWRGDLRRNSGPYFIGKGMSSNELGFCHMVKRELNSRGISCHVELIEWKTK